MLLKFVLHTLPRDFNIMYLEIVYLLTWAERHRTIGGVRLTGSRRQLIHWLKARAFTFCETLIPFRTRRPRSMSLAANTQHL